MPTHKHILSRFPDAPIIIYTTGAHERERQDVLKAGAKLFIAKPNIDSLLKAVRDLLS
jgi:DNA-binding NarL/FixJ family response regulator